MNDNVVLTAKQYYERIRDIGIEDVATELLSDRITDRSGDTITCDCPRHASTSHRSLHVNTSKQLWYCFGCQVGGDVLQLVEWVNSGVVTHGRNGNMPDSHRRARDWLGGKLGLPSLSSYGLNSAALSAIEGADSATQRTLLCLTEVAKYYHQQFLANNAAHGWFSGRYALSDGIMASQLIGYAHNMPWTDPNGTKHPGLLNHLLSLGFTHDEVLSTAAFVPHDTSDDPQPFFVGRITLPYWYRGHVVYLIGRKTPWTPPHKWEKGKYRKLRVHDEHINRHVSPAIQNKWLHNEGCLLSKPESVLITEGITDNLSALDAGYSSISPVTTTIRKLDWGRLVPRLSGVKTVYVVGDNEISRVGLESSLKTAQELSRHNIDARVVILPLSEDQRDARRELAERWGISDHLDQQKLVETVRNVPETQIDEYHALVEDAKCDVNAFFAAGGTVDQFNAALAVSVSPVEWALDRISADIDTNALDKELTPILSVAASMEPMQQSRMVDRIVHRFRGKITKKQIEQQIRAVRKEQKHSDKTERARKQWEVNAEPGTCRHAIQTAQAKAALEDEKIETVFAAAAEAAFDWFTSNGAKFFRTRGGKPFMLWTNKIYWLTGKDKTSVYKSVMYDLTGVTTQTASGRVFYEVFQNLAVQHGEERDTFSWLHTDTTKHVVYWALNNEESEIVRISPEGVSVMPNGGNEYEIFLRPSSKMQPIVWIPDVDPDVAEELFDRLIMAPLACTSSDKQLIWLWFSCFILLEFSGSRPMARFEGPSGQGKTTAAKILSTLLYGEQEQKRSSIAADRVDAQRNPILFLDNVETKQMTAERNDFFLVTVTGASNEKRAGGTDSETVIEQPKCLINTTGIEPLSAEYSELVSRSFVVPFNREHFSKSAFIETDLLSEIKLHRNVLLSCLLSKASAALLLLQQGGQRTAMELLLKRFTPFPHERNCAFIALMYVMFLTNFYEDEQRQYLETIHPHFEDMVSRVNQTAAQLSLDANPIVTLLDLVFRLYRQHKDQDNYNDTEAKSFERRYAMSFENSYKMRPATARELCVSLGKLAGDYRVPFPHHTPHRFASRFTNDLATILDAGYSVEIRRMNGNRRAYVIEQLDSDRDHEGGHDEAMPVF